MQVKFNSNPNLSLIGLPTNIKKGLIFIEQSSVLQQLELINNIAKLVKKPLLHIKAFSVLENIEKAIYENFPHLPIHFSQLDSADLSNYLQQQKIGTHMIVIGTRETITEWEKIGTQVGFPLDAIHKIVLEGDLKKVFCVRCYSLFPSQTIEHVLCKNCHSQLDVSNHFSKLHNAYLGYIHI